MKPLISIIVPVYNADQYIDKCIDSILNQSYTNFELLLIDDGSVDNSASICKQYAEEDSRIKYIYKKNGGVSSARNLGIENATGKWVCFVDSDDYIDSDYLLNFGVTNDDHITLYAQGYKIICQENIIIKEPAKVGIFDKKDAYDILEQSDILNSPVFKLYNKGIIDKYKLYFDETVSYGEDHLFSLDYYKFSNKTIIMDFCGYNYIKHDHSLTERSLIIEKLLYYMISFGNKYIAIFPEDSRFTNKSYNIRQYSNLRRLIQESFLQKKTYINLRPQRQELIKYLSTEGLNIKQTIFVKLFCIISRFI